MELVKLEYKYGWAIINFWSSLQLGCWPVYLHTSLQTTLTHTTIKIQTNLSADSLSLDVTVLWIDLALRRDTLTSLIYINRFFLGLKMSMQFWQTSHLAGYLWQTTCYSLLHGANSQFVHMSSHTREKYYYIMCMSALSTTTFISYLTYWKRHPVLSTCQSTATINLISVYLLPLVMS